MSRMNITDAKLVGAMSSYTLNGVHITGHGSKPGACDQPFGNAPKSFIDITLSCGIGLYLLLAVINGVIREVATCGPNGTNITLTTWASQNGWVIAEKRITNIF